MSLKRFNKASTPCLRWRKRLRGERSCNYHLLHYDNDTSDPSFDSDSGDPHITQLQDGSTDPLHVSGLLGKGNLKRSNRATSFHYYIDTGDLVFSDKQYPPLRVAENAGGPAAIPAHQKASDWVWDEAYQRYRYHDGKNWIWQEETGERSSSKSN